MPLACRDSCRALDLAAAAMGLWLLSPVLWMLALLIRLDSRGPVFFKGVRVGKEGRPIRVWKFRTMIKDAPRKGPPITTARDPRVTRVGRILRRYKLDELPQLVNVLKGEMALVGPRPEDPKYVAAYDERHREILSVRPGITSPASLAYRDEESLLSGMGWEKKYVEQILPHKLELELRYLPQRSPSQDVTLILRTIFSLHHRENALR